MFTSVLHWSPAKEPEGLEVCKLPEDRRQFFGNGACQKGALTSVFRVKLLFVPAAQRSIALGKSWSATSSSRFLTAYQCSPVSCGFLIGGIKLGSLVHHVA